MSKAAFVPHSNSGLVRRSELRPAGAQPKTEKTQHETHCDAFVQQTKLSTSVTIKFTRADDGKGQIQSERHASYAGSYSDSRRDLHMSQYVQTLPRRRRLGMHRQQHARQPHLFPAAGQFQHDVAIGLAGTLAHQRLGAL